ncbi:OmpL47-type beta-barrel domain-containing protein [Peribacillus deserti]|uniref:OmpL47-type beta-barrel domain-containing protein n=1 Tax=Peribacillus deserti TaxID=673318 RepID=UPI002152D868|nr:hypothetical protein [Peribacillus deserti]
MLLTVLVVTNALAGHIGNAFAASDSAAAVLPDGQGKKVLFDNTHGQTAGAADWVIDGAFSDFAKGLTDAGFSVEELSRQIPYTFGEQAVTYEKLKRYDVFIIGEANIPYKKSEQDAMEQYVREGGSIFFIADHYNADRNKNRWDASEVMNGYRRGAFANPAKGMTAEEAGSPAMQGVQSSDWLGSNFGIRFRYNAIGDVTAADIAAPAQSFGITEGVDSVAMHAGSTLAIVDPSKAKGIVYLPSTNTRWGNAVDKGVYNGGGRAEGPYAAISKLGQGKAAFIGDSSPVEDGSPKYLREENGSKKTTYDGFKEQDDGKFLVQTVKWLANKESYTSFDQVPGMELDQPTKLILDPSQKENEDPATSIEPQVEPWAAPAAGYKWYDSKTFRPGSYGASEGTQPPPPPVGQAAYKLVYQNVLPNSQEFQVRVEVDGAAAGSTVSNLNLGIYLTGGTQVAKVQNADGTWPNTYGYSSNFSVTADKTGHASKTLTIKVQPGTTGSANMRLRQGSTNVKTEAVTFGNVPAEPLPNENTAPEVISIQDARKQADGTVVTVEGTITSKPGAFGGQGFYLQEGASGIYVFQNTTGFTSGDSVRITAVKKTFNTEIELADPVKIEKIGTADIPAAAVQSSVNDANQGTLITLENVQIKNLPAAGTSGSFEFDAINGQSTTRVRVDSRTGISFADWSKSFAEGDILNITGISSVFKGVYQLKPLSQDHFELSDITAPVTAVTANGLTGEKYNNRDVTVIFTGDDGNGTGISKTEYRLNSGEWRTVTEPVVISEEGKNRIAYRSVDKAGNVENEKSVEVWIDKTAPQISLDGELAFYQTDSEMDTQFSVEDNLSGVVKVEYALDGNVVSSISEVKPLSLTPGEHTLTVWAEDTAGNIASKEYKLFILMDIDHLDELIDLGAANHAITKQGIVTSLHAQVKAAQKAKTADMLHALLNHIQAQKSKAITEDFAQVVEEDIKYILENELD